MTLADAFLASAEGKPLPRRRGVQIPQLLPEGDCMPKRIHTMIEAQITGPAQCRQTRLEAGGEQQPRESPGSGPAPLGVLGRHLQSHHRLVGSAETAEVTIACPEGQVPFDQNTCVEVDAEDPPTTSPGGQCDHGGQGCTPPLGSGAERAPHMRVHPDYPRLRRVRKSSPFYQAADHGC